MNAPSIPARRFFRVDPRLVHATTMNVWVPTTGARTVLVVDGSVASDPRRRAIIELSAMGAAEIRFANEAAAAEMLNRLAAQDPALVLFSDLPAVERSVDAGLRIDRLNIGHLPEAPDRAPIHPAVHIGPRDTEIVQRLFNRGIEVIIQPLPSDKMIAAPRPKDPSGPHPMVKVGRIDTALRVLNAKGLHLRAAHLLAHLAGKLPCEVHIGPNKSHRVNAKSLLGLTTLGATCGTELLVSVEGPDAEDSMKQIKDLFASGFDEGADWTPDSGETS